MMKMRGIDEWSAKFEGGEEVVGVIVRKEKIDQENGN